MPTPTTGAPLPPGPGDLAPPLDLPALGGGRLDLTALRGAPVLVSFLRHAGWLICRAHLVKVLHHRDRVERTGGAAVFVVHDPPERVRAGLLRDLDVPWPVLVDLDRVAYRAWGLRRAAFRTVWLDPRVWGRYARLLLGGQRLQRLGRDSLQLGGDFVVGPDGVVTWARPQRADDRPPVGVLLDQLERAARRWPGPRSGAFGTLP